MRTAAISRRHYGLWSLHAGGEMSGRLGQQWKEIFCLQKRARTSDYIVVGLLCREKVRRGADSHQTWQLVAEESATCWGRSDED